MRPPTKQQAIGYLSAMVDGEGYVGVRSSRKGSSKIQVCVNTDRSIIRWTCACLDLLGIEYHVKQRTKSRNPKHQHWKKAWYVDIYKRDEIAKFAKLVPLRSEQKKKRLEALVSMPRKRPPPTREQIYELYVVRRLSIFETMLELGFKSSGGVWYWMKKYGIKSRNLSESTWISWNHGKRGQADAVH